jgi:hypothetical protein
VGGEKKFIWISQFNTTIHDPRIPRLHTSKSS